MDREEAAQALALLRRVVERARDETALQNWGLVWIVHGFTNGGAFVATDVLMQCGSRTPWHYAALWGAVLGLDFLLILALKAGGSGVRTFVENQVWLIWTTFIAAGTLTCVLNWLMGLETIFAGVVLAVLSAVAFSAMGGVMGKGWFVYAIAFALVAVAMALVPGWQFTLLGAAWLLGETGAGVRLALERRRRLASGATDGPRLV